MSDVHFRPTRLAILAVVLCLVGARAAYADVFLYSPLVREHRAGDVFAVTVNDAGNAVRDVNLTDHPANEGGPRWSLDGSRIVFISNRDGESRLYFMDADGGNVQPVTPDERVQGILGYPSWSPDGARIAVTVWDDAFVIEVVSGRAELVYTAPNRLLLAHCRWSPGGVLLALHDGWADVAILNTDTGTARDVPDGDWIEWSRLGLLVLRSRLPPALGGACYQRPPHHGRCDCPSVRRVGAVDARTHAPQVQTPNGLPVNVVDSDGNVGVHSSGSESNSNARGFSRRY